MTRSTRGVGCPRRYVITPTPKLRGLIANLVGALKRLHGYPTRRDMPKESPPVITWHNAARLFGEADAEKDFR
jgi:hypothetical protein